MTEATASAPGGREIRLRYDGTCRECGARLNAGTRARWETISRTIRCLTCPPESKLPTAAVADEPRSAAHPLPASPPSRTSRPTSADFGVAGASAQRRFDAQESRRRTRLRTNWPWIVLASGLGGLAGSVVINLMQIDSVLLVVVGAAIPLLKLLPTPQHVDAWRSGAAGERSVGGRLDRLTRHGVIAVHDRRIPGRRTNIDHIVVAPGGVFVVDTKNVRGKVSVTRSGVRVAGRRRDEMITGLRDQVEVVRNALADQHLPQHLVRGVLCFTRADLPWLRPSPGGVQLLYPRGLARQLRRSGPLPPERVHEIATLIARRLPAA